MPVIQSRPVIKAPDVMLQDLKGEAVLLNLANGTYYGLDENSYHMYRTLISAGSFDATYEALCREYDADPRQLRSDLEKFVTQLFDHGLLIYADESSE